MSQEKADQAPGAVARAGVIPHSVHPAVAARVATDPRVLDQGRVFAEAVNQTQPLANRDSEIRQIANLVCKGTGQPRGISRAAAERMAASPRKLESFTQGPNPRGLAAEVVAVADYRALHAGANPGIVNSPQHVSPSVRDIRLAPDSSSRKDLVLAIDMKGRVVWKYNGQVKTGGPGYVCSSLVKMAKTPDYGKVGYVDARYVNPDGTPRVAPDAFTSTQARRLQEAQVRLRGLPDLEARADLLIENINASKRDGLNPVARHELQLLRDDIAAAYGARGVLGRLGGGAAVAAASAAVVSLAVQLATDGEVDAKAVGKSAVVASVFGVGGVAADAGLYHLATHRLEMAPEVAKEFAKRGVGTCFCVVAVGTDLTSEARAARRREVTAVGAVGGAAAKTALDLLPLVMAPLGLAGLPILVGIQIGGRMLVEKARESDRALAEAVANDDELADRIDDRIAKFSAEVADVAAISAETDAVFNQVMARDASHGQSLAAVGVEFPAVRSRT